MLLAGDGFRPDNAQDRAEFFFVWKADNLFRSHSVILQPDSEPYTLGGEHTALVQFYFELSRPTGMTSKGELLANCNFCSFSHFQ